MIIMTTDEEFASCERSDHILRALIGNNLQQATLRLVLIGVALSALLAFVS